MHSLLRRLVFLMAALPSTRMAAGQSSPTRVSLDAFRDSLAAVTDTIQLARIVRQERAAARRSKQDALLQIRYGFALLRLAETDGRLFNRARDGFARAARLEPGWVYPHLGIGLAETSKGNWLAGEPANLGTRVGFGAYQAAARALLEALRLEPMFSPALHQLDQVSTVLRDSGIVREILEAHRAAVSVGSQDPDVLLNLGRLERATGDLDSASARFEQISRSRDASPLALLELARTHLAEHSPEGLAEYYQAATSNDPQVVAQLRSDLVPITPDSVLKGFDGTEGPERVQFLQQFWRERERSDLRTPGERIAEHYRRLLYARRHFSLAINRRYYGARDLYRDPGSEVDDRGVIYVRQGEPDERLRPMIFGLMPNETWVYRRPEGDLIMHFSAGGENTEGGDLYDYRLVGSVLDLRGGRDAPMDMVLLSRAGVSDIYQKMLAWGPRGAARAQVDEREIGEASASVGTSTDSYELRFENPLDAVADLVSIGKENGTALLHVVFVLRGGGIDSSMDSSGVRVGLRLSLLGPRASGEMIDTEVIARPIPSGDAVGHLAVAMPAGSWRYRLALIRGADHGIVFKRDSIVIPAYPVDSLAITDLGIGREGWGVLWRTSPNDSVRLSPERSFETDDDLMLYYELYGLIPGEAYQTSIAVYEQRNRRVGRALLQFTFTQKADGVLMREHRTIKLAGLPPGRYLLGVTVRDLRGSTRSSLGGFTVSGGNGVKSGR